MEIRRYFVIYRPKLLMVMFTKNKRLKLWFSGSFGSHKLFNQFSLIRRTRKKRFYNHLGGVAFHWASLVAQRLKRLPAMRETWVQSLGQKDPLEEEMATHSSILGWRIPWMEEPGGQQSIGSQRVRHAWVIYGYGPFTGIFPLNIIGVREWGHKSRWRNWWNKIYQCFSVPSLAEQPWFWWCPWVLMIFF